MDIKDFAKVLETFRDCSQGSQDTPFNMFSATHTCRPKLLDNLLGSLPRYTMNETAYDDLEDG